MNSKLSVQERERLSTETAMAMSGFKEEKAPMSRREKLMRWAAIVRAYPDMLVLFHLLERRSPNELKEITHRHSAFALAYNDPALNAAGMTDPSAFGAMQFFELTRDELHEFSCDCGGHITNNEMARRIEKIADGKSADSKSADGKSGLMRHAMARIARLYG